MVPRPQLRTPVVATPKSTIAFDIMAGFRNAMGLRSPLSVDLPVGAMPCFGVCFCRIADGFLARALGHASVDDFAHAGVPLLQLHQPPQ
jgi:hypothetical protein